MAESKKQPVTNFRDLPPHVQDTINRSIEDYEQGRFVDWEPMNLA